MFADDNSAYRRVIRRKEQEEKRREKRRGEILDTLRRLKAQANDPSIVDERERQRRHESFLEKYPPLF